MKADMAKIMMHYQGSEPYRKQIEDLIKPSESLNGLLTELGKNYTELLREAAVQAPLPQANHAPGPAQQPGQNPSQPPTTENLKQPEKADQNISKDKNNDHKTP